MADVLVAEPSRTGPVTDTQGQRPDDVSRGEELRGEGVGLSLLHRIAGDHVGVSGGEAGQRLRAGVVGLGKQALEDHIPGLGECDGAVLVATLVTVSLVHWRCRRA
jgi:hypothetical protein